MMEWGPALQIAGGLGSTVTAVICALLLYRVGQVEKELERTRTRLHGIESQMIAYRWMIRILGDKAGMDMSSIADEKP